MKSNLLLNRRTITLLLILLPLAAGFLYVAFRSGPLAPIPVTLVTVENHSLTPALFGIGTVEARHRYDIGPTQPGRVKTLSVHVGEHVHQGQLLGSMDPVDLNDRIRAQQAALAATQSAIKAAQAQVQDGSARLKYANAQSHRYQKLLVGHLTSPDVAEAKEQSQQTASANLVRAQANLQSARQSRDQIQANLDGLIEQRKNLQLRAPVDALVVARNVDPGTTVVAGQSVVQLIDPKHIWVNVRFDQLGSRGLRRDLPAHVVLRSESDTTIQGQVLRVEPLADSVTEETLAKIRFDQQPEPLPPLGELAEVTVTLPALPKTPVLPEACLRQVNGHLGAWVIDQGALHFVPLKLGRRDLNGRVQILEGLKPGAQVIRYSQRPLSGHNRLRIMDHIPGVPHEAGS